MAQLYTDRELEEGVKEAYYYYKRTREGFERLTGDDYREYRTNKDNTLATYKAVIRRLGNWLDLKERLGLEPTEEKLDYREVKRCIKEINKETEGILTIRKYDKKAKAKGYPTAAKIVVRYGKWNNIKRDIGLNINPRKSYNNLSGVSFKDKHYSFCKDCMYIQDCETNIDDCEHYNPESVKLWKESING